MASISTIALLALALSNPTFAADGDVVPSGGRIIQPVTEAAPWGGLQPFHARGPGALFASVEAAAIDALTYAYLQARESRDTARIRGGTIYPVGSHYSYGEIQLANPLTPHRISYRFGPREVARFHAYPLLRDVRTNRANERISRRDRRSVSVIDPLHRPLYILHPSLAIRAYCGDGSQGVEVADLRRQERASLLAEN